MGSVIGMPSSNAEIENPNPRGSTCSPKGWIRFLFLGQPGRDDEKGTRPVERVNRTSVQGSDEAPIPCVYDAMFTAPTLAPLDAVAAVSAIVLRPEVEIERRDKKNPVESRECAGVGRVIRLGRAQMQRVSVPGPRGIAVLDEAIPNLYKRDGQHLRIARRAKKKKARTYCAAAVTPSSLIWTRSWTD